MIPNSGQIYLTTVMSNSLVNCIKREPIPSAKVYTKRENQSMSNTAKRIKEQIIFFSRWRVTYASENCFFWVCYCFKAIKINWKSKSKNILSSSPNNICHCGINIFQLICHFKRPRRLWIPGMLKKNYCLGFTCVYLLRLNTKLGPIRPHLLAQFPLLFISITHSVLEKT